MNEKEIQQKKFEETIKNTYEAEQSFKQSIDHLIKVIPNDDCLIDWSWSCEKEKLTYDLSENLKVYFLAFSSVLNMEDDFKEQIYSFFVSDIKLSILLDESILISNKIDKKNNNDKFRTLFNTLNEELFSSKKEMEIDNIATNLYLKPLQPLVKLTLLHSKKRSKSLIDRFNGFRLVKASISKEGEFNIYQEAFEILSMFLLSLERSQSNALALAFFSKSTSFLDIHYLSEKYKNIKEYEDKKFDFHFDILASVSSPIMKRTTMKSYKNSNDILYFDLAAKLISIYNHLFNKAKNELNCFLYTEVISKPEQETIYTKFDQYKKIYSLLHKDENYEELIEDLIDEIKSFKKTKEEYENYYEYEEQSVKEFFFENMKVSPLYSLEIFGESYKKIYEKESQK